MQEGEFPPQFCIAERTFCAAGSSKVLKGASEILKEISPCLKQTQNNSAEAKDERPESFDGWNIGGFGETG